MLERGKAEQTIKQLDYFREAVIAYRKSITHYPTEHQLTHNFGQLLINIGDAFVKTGKADLMEEGEEYRAQAGIAFKRASMLARYKHDVLGLR